MFTQERILVKHVEGRDGSMRVSLNLNLFFLLSCLKGD